MTPEDQTSGLKVVVVGAGLWASPSPMRAVEVGYDVVGLEVDSEKVSALMTGISHVEDVPDAALVNAIATGAIVASVDPAAGGFDVAVITVPTPLEGHAAGPELHRGGSWRDCSSPDRGATVVLESTTHPGTTELLVPSSKQAQG